MDRRIRKRKKQREKIVYISIFGIALLVLLVPAVLLIRYFASGGGEPEISKVVTDAPDFEVDLLTINQYSRPGNPADEITGIVIHYTANPTTTAKNNRDYFEGLKDSGLTYASSHFIIGLDGEIVQCVPTAEIAYASNERNSDTVSIECCHLLEDGAFTQETYDSLVGLTAFLLGKFSLTTDDIIRHYDINGKNCPKYYVENPDAWETFRKDVAVYIEKNGVTIESEED